MSPAFVLDCSVAMAWCFEDESDPDAERALQRLEEASAIVPGLWHLETLNVLLGAERKKRLTPSQTHQLLTFLSELPILSDSENSPTKSSTILDLGRRFGITSYDAAYVELALRLGLPLATLDRKLQAAAKMAGVASLSE